MPLIPLRPRAHDAPRLVPDEGISPGGAGSGHDWIAEAGAARFRLPVGPLLPGWYLLEVALEHDQGVADGMLVSESARPGGAALRYSLPIRPGRMSRRVVWLPGLRRPLRFAVLNRPGPFTIRHFRLRWLPALLARRRLVKRLATVHPRWRSVPAVAVLSGVRAEARRQGLPWRQLALRYYEQTYRRRCIERDYHEWLAERSEADAGELQQRIARLRQRPVISLLLPLMDARGNSLRPCLEALAQQSYPHWQLCIVSHEKIDTEVIEWLRSHQQSEPRIRLNAGESGTVAQLANRALTLADGELLLLLDPADRLPPDALWRIAAACDEQPGVVLVYGDSDWLDADGERCRPQFKPDWNPDLLLAQDYIGRPVAYRTERVRMLGGFREAFDGCHEYDLLLRHVAGVAAEAVVHVPQIRYHRSLASAADGAVTAAGAQTDACAEQALREHLARVAPRASVRTTPWPGVHRVSWPLPEPAPLVSLVVPTRDRVDVLRPCVEALLARTDYPHLELLIVDNQSRCAETLAFMKDLAERDPRVRLLEWDQPFNYAAINNLAAGEARGEILALLNNDVEPIGADWLREMVGHACRPEIGCVGAKLYYPDDTVQHAGVILGIGGVAGHGHKYCRRADAGFAGRLVSTQNLSAVTGACLVLRKALFDEAGGFNAEALPIAFNDVDLCLRVRQAGYRNLWTPYAELYHHESVSRGGNDTGGKRARAAREVAYMRRTWGDLLDHDPAYNPNLTLVHEDFSLR